MVGHPPRRAHRLSLVVVLALLGSAGPTAAAGADAEVTDRANDATPASFLWRSQENAWAYDAFGSYDILEGRILGDTADLLVFQATVRAIPDAWGLLPKIPAGADHAFGPAASQPTVHVLVFFTVDDVDYQADAMLSVPDGAGVMERYVLRSGYRNDPVFGSVDAQADVVTLAVPRALVGDPPNGTAVTRIRFEGRIDHHKIDLAPDPVPWDPDNASHADFGYVVRRMAGTQLVEPTFGRDYAMGSRANATEPGSLASTAAVVERPIWPGNQTGYEFVVHNRANVTDTVRLVVSSAANGSAHAVHAAAIELGPLANATIHLNVTLHPQANGSYHTDVRAFSLRGAASALTFTTRADPDAVLPAPEEPAVVFMGPEWRPAAAQAETPAEETVVRQETGSDPRLIHLMELLLLLIVVLIIVALTRKR